MPDSAERGEYNKLLLIVKRFTTDIQLQILLPGEGLSGKILAAE
jgi:hypothetical protein